MAVEPFGRILIVDDEPKLKDILCTTLSGQGYETHGFTSGREALEALREENFDILLTDLVMPETDGISLVKDALEIDPHLVGIVMTGQGTVQSAVEAMKTGAFDYLLKPFKISTILPAISRAMEVRRLKLENIQLKETVAMYELGKTIFYSLDFNTILNKVADAALAQCDADEVSIVLPLREENQFYVALSRGRKDKALLGERIPADRGPLGWVVANRQPLVLSGTIDDTNIMPCHPRNEIVSAISIPMLVGGNLIGFST
jgi:Response regulator containing CheY-like receiver, AAA-type ATPase, and DNA-binding domains